MLNPITLRRLASLLIVTAVAACGGDSDRPPPNADSAAMANMPGMKMSGDAAKPDSMAATNASEIPASLTLTASQLSHGKIRWANVTVGSAATTASIPGQVTTDEDRTVRLGAPVRGRVLSVRVNEGDRVTSGQTLVVIQSPDAGSAQSDVAKASAMVSSRRAQAVYAKGARDRAERLLALKAIPKQDYDRAVADDELAQSELREADAELRRARNTASQMGADDDANGTVQVRAPFSGVVLARSAVPGTFIEAGLPLIIVTDPSRLWLTVSAPEQFAGLFSLGSALRFVVPAYPDTFSARITALGAGLDPDTRTLGVRASLDSRGNRLKPGMLANALVVGGSTAGAVMVPEEAVQTIDGKPTVFVAHPDGKGGARLERRAVEVGSRGGGRVAVLSGLRLTDQIVTVGSFVVKSAFMKGGMAEMVM